MLVKNNLLLRILSGVCLGAIAIWGVVWSNFVLNLLLAVGAVVAGLEWSQIVESKTRSVRNFWTIIKDRKLIVLPLTLLLLWIFGSRTHTPSYIGELLGIAALFALNVLFHRASSLLDLCGFFAIGPTILSLLALHQGENWHALIFLLASVSATDIGAFAFGKIIGGRKLALRISPNKTWAGSIGGLLSAGIVAGILSHWLGEVSAIHSIAIGMVLSLLAQAGDLAESALKRRFSVKDSGFLIPGHGGILDRIDGLLLAAPIFTLYRIWLGGPL